MTGYVGARSAGPGTAGSPAATGGPVTRASLAGATLPGAVPDATGHFGIYGGSFAPEGH
jgi:hypothetical protein